MDEHRLGLLQELSKHLGITITDITVYPVIQRGINKVFYWKFCINDGQAVLLRPRQMKSPQSFRLAFINQGLLLPKMIAPNLWQFMIGKFKMAAQTGIYEKNDW